MLTYLGNAAFSKSSDISPLCHAPNDQSVNFEFSNSKIKLLFLQDES
jgi:hypothetical protein